MLFVHMANPYSWWALWIEDPGNLRNSFFVKNYYNIWTWIFLMLCLKTKKKQKNQKWCKPSRNSLTEQEAKGKQWKKRKKSGKQKVK